MLKVYIKSKCNDALRKYYLSKFMKVVKRKFTFTQRTFTGPKNTTFDKLVLKLALNMACSYTAIPTPTIIAPNSPQL